MSRGRCEHSRPRGVHGITTVGCDRQTSIDFCEVVLGLPCVFAQPDLDNVLESNLYFEPGDGRPITVCTNGSAGPTRDARPSGIRTATSCSRSTAPVGRGDYGVAENHLADATRSS